MIVAPADGGLRVVTQPDHAAFAAELLALWRRDGMPDHRRRADLLFAVREHDNGWREVDAAPHVDPETGRLHDFLTLPDEIRRELWVRGVDRFADARPYPSLLILRHTLRLHGRRAGWPAWEPFFAALAEREAELLERCPAAPEALAADDRFLALADGLSLAVCTGRDEATQSHGYRARPAGGELAIAPFPLAGATRFRVPCRMLPDRAFRDAVDAATELARARWIELAVHVVPGPA